MSSFISANLGASPVVAIIHAVKRVFGRADRQRTLATHFLFCFIPESEHKAYEQ